MYLKLIVPALLSLASLGVPAFADQYQFTLDQCTRGCGTASFGTVNVTQKGVNTVTIAVNLSAGNKFVSSGSAKAGFAFDIIGNPKITLSNLTGGWSLINSQAGSLHFADFGYLDYAVTCRNNGCGPGGSRPYSGPISFDVTAPGLTPASFKELSRPGSEAAYFVADIVGTTGDPVLVGATFSETQASATPEPGSLLLLSTGVGLLGFSCFWRRRKA